MSYSEGWCRRAGGLRGAYKKFNEALAKDPSYEKAHLKAESISHYSGADA